jgi:hypothetical protein
MLAWPQGAEEGHKLTSVRDKRDMDLAATSQRLDYSYFSAAMGSTFAARRAGR